MPDVRVVPITGPITVTYSWLQTPTGLLDETQELVTAFVVAFNTDARADPDEVLPDPRSSDRRGWWGDLDAQKIWNGWPIGSKLWLLSRAKIVDAGAREGATIVRVKNYLLQAAQPFIDNRICSAVTVDVAQPGVNHITANVMIYRGPKTAIQLNFDPLWADLFPGA